MESKEKDRSSPLSEQAKAERRPSPPEELLGALQDRIHVQPGRLRSATPIKKIDRT